MYNKKWYLEHKENLKRANKKYYSSEKGKNKIKEWREKNKEKIKEYHKTAYLEWRKKNPYKISPPGEGWKNIRKKVLLRDNYTCKKCGKMATEIHHLDGTGSNRIIKLQNNNLNNLISVCHRCHMKFDLERFENGFNKKGIWQEKTERNKRIFELTKFLNQTQISKEMNLTRQRISQIVKKFDRNP